MFHLKTEPNKDGTRLIYLIFSYHANRFKLSTSLNIHPDNWDSKRERPKRGFKYYTQIAALLDRYEAVLHEAYYEFLLTCIPSKAMLKAAIKAKLNQAAPLTVGQYAARYAETRQGITPGRRMQLKNTAEFINKFNPKLTFDQLDLAVMLDFRDWLYTQEGRTGNLLSTGYVTGIFKRFKTILNDATETGVNTNMKYKNRKATVAKAESTAIFLNEEELDRIRSADIPEHLHKYRDILLVSCYTGTRFQDIFRINRSSFVESERYFKIMDTKQNAVAQIPLHPVVLEIMNRNEWNLPVVSNVMFNRNIKEVGRLAKIDYELVVTTFPGNVRVDTVKCAYELITAHTGRRSLITNLFISGVSREVVKMISGHKSDRELEKYVKMNVGDKLRLAYKSSFFDKAKLKVV